MRDREVPKRADVPTRTATYWRPPSASSDLARRTCGWLLGLVLLALILFSVMSENGLGEYLRLRGQHDRLERELQALREENAQMEARLDALRNDPFALEKLARERYNMRREGEEVLLLVPERQVAVDEGRR